MDPTRVDTAIGHLFKALDISPIDVGSLTLYFEPGARLMKFVPAPQIKVPRAKKAVAEAVRSVHTR